jgi:hypothetical protein
VPNGKGSTRTDGPISAPNLSQEHIDDLPILSPFLGIRRSRFAYFLFDQKFFEIHKTTHSRNNIDGNITHPKTKVVI